MSHSLNQHQRALVNYLPGGRLYSSALKTDSNLYKFLYGMAQELKRNGDYIENYRENILPDSKPRSLINDIVTNLVELPRDLSGWVQIGTAVSVYDAIGIDGLAGRATTITDDNAGLSEGVQDDIITPDDSNTNISQIFIRKDSDTSRFPEILLSYEGGVTQNIAIQLNTQTGDTNQRLLTGVGSHTIENWGDWWRLIIQLDNNSTGNVTAKFYVYPAITTTLGVVETSATGSCIADYATFELNKTVPSNVFEEAIGADYGFIEEWESALGIPDDCFPGPGIPSFELRRNHLLAKLASSGVQSEQDFIDLAAVFGLSATIAQIGKFTIEITTEVLEIVAFPLVFPISFSVSQTGVYQCVATKLKPANCDIVFVTT